MLFQKSHRILQGIARTWARQLSLKPEPISASTRFQDTSSNREMRTKLAASYRALDMLGLGEGVCNHLSVMAPAQDGRGEVMLLVSYGLHWSEVRPSSLVGLNDKNEVVEGTGLPELTAANIHRGVRRVRPDVKCVFHIHPPYATTLACLKDPTLHMIHQNSVRFLNRVAYDKEYAGVACDLDEGERLGVELGDKDIMFMGNHGVLVTSDDIACAFDDCYYLERAAEIQVLAMSTGKELSHVEGTMLEETRRGLENMRYYANAHFNSFIRRIRVSDPQFEH